MKKFKVVEIESAGIYHVFKETDFSELEKKLAEYSNAGWEVVSVCPNNYMDNVHGSFLVTLQRES